VGLGFLRERRSEYAMGVFCRRGNEERQCEIRILYPGSSGIPMFLFGTDLKASCFMLEHSSTSQLRL
jgi:hypothetical protein